MSNRLYVQYGCGFHAPEEWINFDASPTLVLEQMFFLKSVIRKNERKFPSNVKYGNIVKGLPIEKGTVTGLYASHILANLSREEFFIALINSFGYLRPGGVFRLIVPDFEARARYYLRCLEQGSSSANDTFMKDTALGVEQRPRGAKEWLIHVFGRSRQLWMWDYPSMCVALSNAGFTDIRRCRYGDSNDPMFSLVEEKSRFDDSRYIELAMEVRRPDA